MFCGDAGIVRQIIEGAAEGIEHHRVLAPFGRQDPQGEGQIGLRAAGDLLGIRHGAF